ncbi:hypothetical protein, partial [Enhygromyxa salina]|uniref:hypothetical protein n=1 Tax=Enhygromyxa salina TaxID=215803 RepID=UPI001969ADD9
DEFGHGSWRTREILLQKFRGFLELRQLDGAENSERKILKLDSDAQQWARYTSDALWLGKLYIEIAEIRRATKVLRAGRARAAEQHLSGEVARFDHALEEIGGQ